MLPPTEESRHCKQFIEQASFTLVIDYLSILASRLLPVWRRPNPLQLSSCFSFLLVGELTSFLRSIPISLEYFSGFYPAFFQILQSQECSVFQVGCNARKTLSWLVMGPTGSKFFLGFSRHHVYCVIWLQSILHVQGHNAPMESSPRRLRVSGTSHFGFMSKTSINTVLCKTV